MTKTTALHVPVADPGGVPRLPLFYGSGFLPPPPPSPHLTAPYLSGSARVTLLSTFLLRPQHDYDMKPPNATLYGERGHTTTNFSFSILTWVKPLRIQLQKKWPTFDELSGSK